MGLACEHDTLSDFGTSSTKFVPFRPRTDAQRRHHWKSVERVRRGFYGRNTNLVREAINEQIDHVIRNVRQSRRVDAVPNAVDAATNQIRDTYAESILKLYRRTLPRFAELTDAELPKRARLPHERKQNEGDTVVGGEPSDPSPPPSVWAQAAQRVVRQNAGTLIHAPTRYTKRILVTATRSAVQRGLERGWGIPKIADEIERESRGRAAGKRAVTIARTETIRASNAGAMVAADRSGLSLKKEWIATMDDRVRPTHEAANGQTVNRDEQFVVGGFRCRYPADSKLPAGESINCRCTVAFHPRR